MKKKWNVVVICLSFVLLSLLLGISFLFKPTLTLRGETNVVLSYKDAYEEKGAEGTWLGKREDSIKVSGNLKEGVVGKYDISYEIKKGFWKTEKTRHIKVIDEEKPQLIWNDTEISCGNMKLSYEAKDDYDGNLTDRVEKEVVGDTIFLTVSDSSGNVTKLEKKIDESKRSLMLTLKGSATIYVPLGTSYEEPGFQATDSCSGDISSLVKVSGSVDTSKAGSQILTYEVTNEMGNTKKATREVIVYNKAEIPSGNQEPGVIYLTFDDGPSNGTTNQILDILKKEHVKATFFVTGIGPDDLIKREFEEGHTVGLHTYSHKWSIYRSVETYFNDLNLISARVKRITGEESKIIRFPGGSSNTISKSASKGIMTILTNEVINRGYHYFDWNVAGGDAVAHPSADSIYKSVTKNLSKKRANIVLLHDIKGATRDALPKIISFGKANGYVFKAITMETQMVRHRVAN